MLPISPGDLLAGRFEVLRPLGAGGLAEVFAAHDRVAGAEVAIKALHAHLSGDASLCERFRRELAVTRALSHPGIVRVFDLYEHRAAGSPEQGSRPFFTMELLRGQTLAERLERGLLPEGEAREIARQIALALQAAHRAGVVHRDLKPLNVILVDDGSPGATGVNSGSLRVKLLDFGLARVAGAARLTAQSTVLGTPAYLAPEILSGRGCDARADLYALGAVLFELFTGERAFTAADPFEVIRRKGQPPPSARARRQQVSEADDLLIRRALEPDPERRFLDAGQVLSALAGRAPPAPMIPPPALTAGALDVVLHHGALGEQAPVEDVLRAVGSPAGPGWRARLRLAGEAVLVSKASRDTAEAVAALCQERGLAVALQPAAERSPLRERLAKLAGPIGGATGLAVGGGIGAVVFSGLSASALAPEALVIGGIGVGYALLTGAIAWTLAGLGEAPPLRALPAGDPAVRRLLDGIQRRTARLQARSDELPGAQQVLYGPLLETAERLRATALELGEPAATMPDPMAMGEAEALSPGNAAARDQAVARLLEIAAALDEALAAMVPGHDPGQGQEQALARLKAEVRFAEQALPRIERARRGEETPLPV